MDVKIKLIKAVVFLENHTRFILAGLFLFFIIIVFLIYYQYVYLSLEAQPEPELDKITIDQIILKKVTDNLESREENLSRVKGKSYQDPFRAK